MCLKNFLDLLSQRLLPFTHTTSQCFSLFHYITERSHPRIIYINDFNCFKPFLSFVWVSHYLFRLLYFPETPLLSNLGHYTPSIVVCVTSFCPPSHSTYLRLLVGLRGEGVGVSNLPRRRHNP